MLNNFFKIIVGLIFAILALMLVTYNSWLAATIVLVKGGIVLTIVLIGLVLIFLGITELKEAI